MYYDTEDNPIEISGTMQDVTDRKKMKEIKRRPQGKGNSIGRGSPLS